MRPVFDELNAQLRQRTPTRAHWQSTGARFEFIQPLSKSIANEIRWPSSYFIPEDPLEIVAFAHFGGRGELIHALVLVERTVSVWLGRELVPELAGRETYGEFVARCWAIVEHSAWARR